MAEATIDRLSIEIEASSDAAAKNVERLTAALKSLKSVSGQSTGLGQVTRQLAELRKATEGMRISATLGSQLQRISQALASIKPADADKLRTLADGLRPLSELGRSNLTSYINQLGKLPAVVAELDRADMGKFASQMKEAAAAIRPLADEMNKVSAGFSAFPIRIQKIIQGNQGLAASNARVARSFTLLGSGSGRSLLQLGAVAVAMRRTVTVAADWVMESNAYVENLNLFTIAMGDAAEEALNYANAVNEAVGIDPSEWIRNQGLFKQITSGFGVAAERADLMSKNLTQLGYDISSFYNISTEEAMQKLQSAISGELEPVRRLGYALDVATLQQVAYNHGIRQSVDTMNQAQKSQLRYVALMEQSGDAMGDLARTLQTPANALRILNQQVTQLSRALGNLLIPFLQEIIPWVQAFVEVMTDAVQWLAELVGFELPQIDDSGVGGLATSGDEAADALGGAAKAAKDLKNATIGIDELNIISPQQQVDTGAGAGGVFQDLGIELPEYDFLAGLDSQVEDLKGKLKDLLQNYVLPIGAALLAWKIEDLGLGGVLKGATRVLGTLSLIWGLFQYVKSAADAWNTGITFENLAGMLTGIAAAVAGIWLLFGKTSAAIALAGFGIHLLTIGFRDWIQNGTTAENTAAIATAIGMIGLAGVLLNNKLLKTIALAAGLATAFLLGLPLISGVINSIIQGTKNLAGAFMNVVLGVSAEFNNLLFAVANMADGIWQVIKDLGYNIYVAFHNAFVNIAKAFNDFALKLFRGFESIGQKVEDLFSVFGMEINLTGGLSSAIDKLSADSAKLESSKLDYKSVEDMKSSFQEGFTRREYYDAKAAFNTFEVFQEGWLENAWSDGKEFGQELQDRTRVFLGNLFDVPVTVERDGFSSTTDSFQNEKLTITNLIDQIGNLRFAAEQGGPSAEFSSAMAGFDPATSLDLTSDFAGLSSQLTSGIEGLGADLGASLTGLTDTLDTGVSDLSTLTELDTQQSQAHFTGLTDFLGTAAADANTLRQNLSDDQIANWNTNASDLKSSISAAASRIVASTDQMRINIYNTYSMGGIGGFASGGFPEHGEMFLARESGPELVGRIGHNTAVANNDQIVEGIRAGVADANAQQNALLAEQNELLRGILAKTGVTLDGRQLLHSVERAERRRGASILSGGGLR